MSLSHPRLIGSSIFQSVRLWYDERDYRLLFWYQLWIIFCHLNHVLNFNLFGCLTNPTKCDPTHISTKCNQSQFLYCCGYITKQNKIMEFFTQSLVVIWIVFSFILYRSNSYVLKWTVNHWCPPSFLSLLELTFLPSWAKSWHPAAFFLYFST
jgi:hypothetical protein